MAICPTCNDPVPEGARTCPRDGTALSAPLVGTVLGDRYRILSVLGEGGMGTVYRAEHVMLGKRVAVKVLRPEFSQREDLAQRFQQEAIAASQIGQENIVDVTDFGRTGEGSLYFVMEEVLGTSLSCFVAQGGAMPIPRALPVLAQICKALGAAHSRGIVHRDLKPDNVIVTQRDDGSDLVKVLDFGISKVESAAERPNTSRLTRQGVIMGTPEYMAPEQAGGIQVDSRADIYSWGVVAYELVTGALPFNGETAIAILMQHQSKPPDPPSQRRPDLEFPPGFEAVILKALEKNPEKRQLSMAVVLEELAGCMAALGLSNQYPAPAAAAALRTTSPAPRRMTGSGTLSLSSQEIIAALALKSAPGSRPSQEDLAAAGLAGKGLSKGLKLGLALALLALAAAAAGLFALRPADQSAASAISAIPDPTPSPGPTPLAPLPPAPVAEPVRPPVPAPPPVPEPPKAAEAPEPRTVQLKSEPPGATVLAGGKKLGVTPLEVQLREGADYRFALEGYRPARHKLRATESEVTVKLVKKHEAPAQAAPAESDNPYEQIDDLKEAPF